MNDPDEHTLDEAWGEDPAVPDQARPTQMCGDETCESRSCSSVALDEWEARQQADARAYVRAYLGLPAEVSS